MRLRSTLLLAVLAGATAPAANAPWVEPMRRAHAKFTGQSGTVAQFGDSITITMAFFVPLQYEIRNVPAHLKPAHAWIRSYVQTRCWRAWKGPRYGNEGRTTTAWAVQHMDEWLERLNPEVAVILWGTNDTYRGPRPPQYTDNLRTIVQKCLDNGTVPILTTIPPKGSQAKNAKERQLVESFVDAARSVAQEKHVPLIDLYKEMLDRQPADFATTLLGDNLHPSYPKEHRQNFRAESLRQSGYTLRNYLTLKACYDVHQQVLSQVKSKRAAASEAGWTGAVLRDQPAVLIPKVDAAPTVDGRMDDACWQKAQLLTFRRLDGDPAKPKSPTHAKLVATKDAVYIAFRCSHAGRLVARERDHDSSVWEDDSVEVFLKAGPEPTRDYHHLIVNALGSFHDARGKDSRAWDPAIQVATDRAAGHWSVEIGIPFAELGLPADKARLAGPWRLNLARMRPARNGEPAEESALSPTEDSSSHVPARFGYAFFEVFGGRLP